MGKKVLKIGTKGSKKGVYNKYQRDDRIKLISMVQEEGRTLASSAKQLGICQTTARLIMSTWKTQGRVFEKKADKAKRQRKEQKKRAQQKRKEKSEPQGGEELLQFEAQNRIAQLKIEETGARIQNVLVQEDGVHVQMTENAYIPYPQPLAYQVQCQMIQIGEMVYMQPVFYVPQSMNTL